MSFKNQYPRIYALMTEYGITDRKVIRVMGGMTYLSSLNEDAVRVLMSMAAKHGREAWPHKTPRQESQSC